MRKLVIAVLPAALAVGHAGAASAWVIVNGIIVNGTQVNGGGDNGQGVSPNGAADAMVISIELPAPVAR